MRIIHSEYNKNAELPLKLKVSFEAIFTYLENLAKNKNHLLNSSAVELLKEYEQYPILRDGFEDLTLLQEYAPQIDRLLDILFPDLLQSNEIKAATIPFEFTTFKLSQRFESILNDAGENYKFKLRNFDESKIYILACTFILAFYHNKAINFRRPFLFDIPSVKTGFTKHYRTLFNGDFFTVKPLESAPPITTEDFDLLIDNFDNIDLWKEKFPPNSYEFKGFGLMNLFDVSPDETISHLKEHLLKNEHDSIDEIEQIISNLFGSKSIKLGTSIYNINDEHIIYRFNKSKNSFLLPSEDLLESNNFFCDTIIDTVFKKTTLFAISDVEKYGRATNYNGLYKVLKKSNIQSIILLPFKLDEDFFTVVEIASEKKQKLNSINANKLKDVIPVFKIATQRYMSEFKNKLDTIIQENYTALHPSVQWKFKEEAQQHYFNLQDDSAVKNNLNDIVFENVVPLYGQSDIKGSSIARNKAVQQDLLKQVNLAANIIRKTSKKYDLPIYKDLLFRINECIKNIENGLNAGDEVKLTDFLTEEIYPVFNHLKDLDESLKTEIEIYMNLIDPKLHVIYEKRKNYDDSVNFLNEEIAEFIDAKQIEAQKMFPHYFERYKTDGVDHNMYIGQSLVKDANYNEMYLHNLRLWQLQMMCDVENLSKNLQEKLSHKLEIASLILVHSTPLAIKFRMDEKRFDVDGAYNIRYEITKKRIDKALIKNTNKRLTIPGKIAIVYNQKKEATEYLKYIQFLQSKQVLLPDVENLELEDLQGTSGLKALRVSVNYKKDNETLKFKELLEIIENPKN